MASAYLRARHTPPAQKKAYRSLGQMPMEPVEVNANWYASAGGGGRGLTGHGQIITSAKTGLAQVCGSGLTRWSQLMVPTEAGTGRGSEIRTISTNPTYPALVIPLTATGVVSGVTCWTPRFHTSRCLTRLSSSPAWLTSRRYGTSTGAGWQQGGNRTHIIRLQSPRGPSRESSSLEPRLVPRLHPATPQK